MDLFHKLLRLYESVNKSQLFFIGSQQCFRPSDIVMHSLAADAEHICGFGIGKIFKDDCFVDLFLMLGQKLAVKIIQ